ncbi:DUF3137 domain-containing protein [Bosea sp. ANAM02]|uniref:DUF3137 domain-containing protein n=1 Tax=Bosea sp. ANAM02 TaxID=2020412 RepID=UPI00140EC00E|nr:DUF3137 domain-containing protein [Bosea sp. ANAM02]BCB19394.1 hypothetical protein OCUBac02_22880 [Bosea sp. ANAM02]
MERPDRPVATQTEEGWSSSAVELQRQQRRAKRIVERIALAVIAGPVCLALLALLIFQFGAGSGWSFLVGLPLFAVAALTSLALPLLVPALFVLGAWALFRNYYRKPPARAAAAQASSEAASPLASEVALLEALRGKLAAEARRRTILFVPLGLAAALLLYRLMIGSGGSSKGSPFVALVIFLVIGGGGAWIWAVGGPGSRYRKAFKDSLIPRLLAAHGELTHSIGTKPDLGRAVALGLLPAYDKLAADDGFAGRYRGRAITISEITVSRKAGKSTETLFQGLYVEIGVSTPFRGTTILRDREGRQPGNGLQRLRLEDPVFEEIYATWSSDQVEGRAVLTPAVMERLLVMADGQSFLPPLFLIGGDRMVFALPAIVPGALFEPPGLETHVAAQQLASLEADFARVFALADAMIDMHVAVRAPHEALPPPPPHPARSPLP